MAGKDQVANAALPKVSVVVLNWNGKRFVDPFMRAYQKLTYPPDRLELVFIDNGSTDDSLDYFKRAYAHHDEPIVIVENGNNYGYAGGNNLGLPHARGDYILICNNDVELQPDTISQLVKVAVDKQAAAVVPKLMYLNKKDTINNAGSRLDTRSDWPIYEIGKDEVDRGQFDSVYEVSALCGACMLLSRDFLSTVGLFDKRFFLYFEDGDLSWRGQKAGRKYYVAPQAVAYHAHAGSSQEGSDLFNYYVGRNRLLILTKNGTFLALSKAWYKTLRDHGTKRFKNLALSLVGRYSKRQALRESWLGCRIIVGAIVLTPYALAKRWHLLKEETL